MENAMLAAKSRAVTLDTESQKQVLAALVPLADRCWDYVQAMQQAGWDVVLPRLNFEASFGEGEVLREYRRYVLELAKVRIANPNIRFRLPEGKPYYSEFLNELRNRRDAEFKGRFEPQDMPIWAQELSICLRRKELLRYSQRSELERRFYAVKGEEQRRRIHEVARYATGASSAFGNELERPARFYRAVTEREFTSSGFTFDNRRSIGEYVVLSKPLVAEWDLCLTPEPLAWYLGRKDGEVCIVLSLQAARHRRPMRRAKWDQVLIIEYVELVPYFDFFYKRFTSLDELETIIIARAFLLSLTIKEIEPRLLAQLSQLGEKSE